jgi:hypothetical protein
VGVREGVRVIECGVVREGVGGVGVIWCGVLRN